MEFLMENIYWELRDKRDQKKNLVRFLLKFNSLRKVHLNFFLFEEKRLNDLSCYFLIKKKFVTRN